MPARQTTKIFCRARGFKTSSFNNTAPPLPLHSRGRLRVGYRPRPDCLQPQQIPQATLPAVKPDCRLLRISDRDFQILTISFVKEVYVA